MAGKKRTIESQMLTTLTRSQLQMFLIKYMRMSVKDLAQAKKNPDLPAMDHAVIAVLVKAINDGDHNRLQFLLDRTYGKVPDHINVSNVPQDFELAKQAYDRFKSAIDAYSERVEVSITEKSIDRE